MSVSYCGFRIFITYLPLSSPPSWHLQIMIEKFSWIGHGELFYSYSIYSNWIGHGMLKRNLLIIDSVSRLN